MAYNEKDILHKKRGRTWGNRIRFTSKVEWLLVFLSTTDDLWILLYRLNFSMCFSQHEFLPGGCFLVLTCPVFWLLCCSVSPPGGRCRTTVALLPVFWGVLPVTAASPGTWTMLLFLTFLMWVALRPQDAAAVMWAEFFLPPVLPFLCTLPYKGCTRCLCQRLICVLTVETTRGLFLCVW